MNVRLLIEHLKMFGLDTEVFIQTVPNDLCSPMERNNISLVPASYDERYGLKQSKVLLTAYFPHELKKKDDK